MNSKIFCAIDTDELNLAIELAIQIGNVTGGIKLGLEFFQKFGSDGIKQVMANTDAKLFLDLKFHDIPNTVAGAVRNACDLNPDFLTIHASGGSEMIKAAKSVMPDNVKLLAVTVLTSIDNQELINIGQGSDIRSQVLKLAKLAKNSGADGVICSPQEIEIIRAEFGEDFILMVPGIRPEGSNIDDQSRVMTPNQALNLGADYLVIGRPITKSENPKLTAENIIANVA